MRLLKTIIFYAAWILFLAALMVSVFQDGKPSGAAIACGFVAVLAGIDLIIDMLEDRDQ